MFVSSEGYRAGAADEAQTESPRIVHREQQVDVRHQQKEARFEDLLEGSFPASPLFRPGKTGVAETEAQNRPTFEAGSDIFDQEADGPDRFVKADDIRIARRARRMGYERAMPVPRSDSAGRAAAVSAQIDSFHTMSMEEDHRYCKEEGHDEIRSLPLRGKRVALVTNQSSFTPDWKSSRLHLHELIGLSCLYAPEHGLGGYVDRGEGVADTTDPLTGLPVRSLYRGEGSTGGL